MAKDTYYFSHDYFARKDPKCIALIKDYHAEGYGIYWCIIEMMYEQGGKIKKFPSLYKAFSHEFDIPLDRLMKQIEAMLHDYELLVEDASFLWSPSVLKRMEKREAKNEANRSKKSEAGKLGGIKSGISRRYKDKSKQNEALLQSKNEANEAFEANEPKERKEKEIKVNENKVNNSASSEENIFDLKTLLNPPKFPTWRAEVAEFLADEYLIQEYIKNKKIPYATVVGFMRQFVTDLNLKGDFKKANAIRIHFNNHYEKHYGSRVLKQTNGFSNAFIDVPDNSDYDKMETWS